MQIDELQISGQSLSLAQVDAVSRGHLVCSLSDSAREKIQAARSVIERCLVCGPAIYGVNTGFGRLSDIRVPDGELETLQSNLVRSHACGLGDPLSEAETRAMILLRANVLAKGLSGCQVLVVETLLDMLRKGVHPVIPEKGSVGASGDLAPLAHLALVLIGEGEAHYRGSRLPGSEAMRAAGVRTLRLTAKDGIALLNGTQAMCAVGGLALHRAVRLTAIADLAGAMTLDALLGSTTAFDERIHQVRPHQGQIHAACHFRRLLDGSEISRSRENKATHVQDAYSLRCMPQVHGAVRGALLHAVQIVEIESGAATDNPLVFPDTGEILNGGNFHGAPLSLAYDYAAIAMVSLMSIAERRIDRLLNPDINEGLPPFLSADPGTSCGYMIAHVCAVALLSEAKVLAHPASADSVPTSAGAEDHVSMGMTAALKLREVIRNAEQVTAIELLAAAEGLRYRAPLRSSMPIEEAVDLLRSLVPPLAGDRPLHRDIETVADAIRQGRFDTF